MRSHLLTAALGTTMLTATLALTTTLAAAQTDGFYNVNYNDIGFELTQVGGYGELIVRPNGFGDMSYGTCQVNFTRDEAGHPKDYSPVVQGSSARCPSELAFAVSEGENGLSKITFTKGGALDGKSFDLFPILQPMRDAFKVTPPKGFDILGMTIGQTRAEIEALLTDKGFAPLEDYDKKADYQGGFSRSTQLWAKGVADVGPAPADQIAVGYTPIFEGEIEKVELLSRAWRVPAADNLSLSNLKKSLVDKHGDPQGSFEARFYDRDGNLVPGAYQPACDETLHLQGQQLEYSLVGEGGLADVSAACGAKVDIMTLEDYSAPGRASQLRVTLTKGDVPYEAFWNTWSRGEEKSLQERYEMQANMTGAAPEL